MTAWRGTSAADPGCGLIPISPRSGCRTGRYRCSRGGFAPTSNTSTAQRISVLSTTWQTVTLMTPQDNDYRAFIIELHRRLEAGGKQGRAGRRIEAGPLSRRRRRAGAGRDCDHRASHSRARHRRMGRRAVPDRFCRAVLLADRRFYPAQQAAAIYVRCVAGAVAAVAMNRRADREPVRGGSTSEDGSVIRRGVRGGGLRLAPSAR